jgi:hypothetical protein
MCRLSTYLPSFGWRSVTVSDTFSWRHKTTVQFDLFCVVVNGADLGNKEVWESAVEFCAVYFALSAKHIAETLSAKFDELQYNRICVADTHLKLIRMIVLILKTEGFPLHANCQLAVWSSAVICVQSWVSWFLCCPGAGSAPYPIQILCCRRRFHC